METYTTLRLLADTWGLAALTLIFVGIIAWAFRPGSRALHEDAARIPLRDADTPLTDAQPHEARQ
ncbi:MAG: cbb3-type cytochrome c oxidase subunit 3 [Alphaproteobacteria bacterium]|nr:MAG: cbb3-type cytochrome c oxidase subunit 3 [Alphaproteobacteria bacterium]